MQRHTQAQNKGMKEKLLRAVREKDQVAYKGKPTRPLKAETLQVRRDWGSIFNILKENNFQPRISYPAKLSFISKGEIKQAHAEGFCYHQACPERAPKRCTKYGKVKPVPATAKTY